MSKSIHDEDVLEEEEDAAGTLSRRTFVAIVVVLVVLSATGVLLLLFTVDEGRVTAVELTQPSRSQDLLTFAYTVSTERASATGQATLTVLFNGSTAFTRPVDVRGGGGRLDVRLADFAVGNGNYTFNLDYKGVRGTARYEIGVPDHTNFIVTSVSTYLKNDTWVGDGHTGALQFSATFYSDEAGGFQAPAPPGSTLVIQLKKNAFPDGQPITLAVEGKTFVTRTLNVSLGPGNYTVETTFTNQWVKATSPLKTFTGSNTSFVHNKPYACIVGTNYRGNNANNFTIVADASCSRDDILIVTYNWNFNDPSDPGVVTNFANPTEAHQYPASTFTRTYTATVEVIDSNGVSDFIDFQVTTAAT